MSGFPSTPAVPAPLRLKNSPTLGAVDCVHVVPNCVALSVDDRKGGAAGAVQRAADA